MPLDVMTEITIDRPIEVVAAYVEDPTHAPEWYANIRSAEWETPLPRGVGSRVAFEARFLGRRLVYTYELVEAVPGRRLVIRTAQGPFPMETSYEWTPEGASTHMTLRNRGRPAGFSRLMMLFMPMAVRRATRKDLARLKALLEA